MCAGCLKKDPRFFFWDTLRMYCRTDLYDCIILQTNIYGNCIDRLVQGVSKRFRLFLGHPVIPTTMEDPNEEKADLKRT